MQRVQVQRWERASDMVSSAKQAIIVAGCTLAGSIGVICVTAAVLVVYILPIAVPALIVMACGRIMGWW